MPKLKNYGEAPSVPHWFTRELRLIDPDFKVMWDRFSGCFLIVSEAPHRIFSRGFIVEHAVSVDGQYRPLTEMVLQTLRRLMYYNNPDYSFDDHMKDLEREAKDRQQKVRHEGAYRKADFRKAYMRRQTTKLFT